MFQAKRLEQLVADAGRFIRQRQKALRITRRYPYLELTGDFYLFEAGQMFDSFRVTISFTPDFPLVQPCLNETGERIQPRTGERHINPDGTCCIGVWEQWLCRETQLTLSNFLDGIVHNYFVQQVAFERNGVWPAGELPHYDEGLIAAYADIFAVRNKGSLVRRYLDVLCAKWPKGHSDCPCGSGRRLRQCCEKKLRELHGRIPPKLAQQMRNRLPRKPGRDYWLKRGSASSSKRG